MYFCKNSIAKTIVSRNARRVLISVLGVNFLFVQHNVTGLCNRLRENDFHTFNGHARAFGFAVAVNS